MFTTIDNVPNDRDERKADKYHSGVCGVSVKPMIPTVTIINFNLLLFLYEGCTGHTQGQAALTVHVQLRDRQDGGE